MKILVTGSSGFLGKHLISGAATLGEVIPTRRTRQDGDNAVAVDLSDRTQVRTLLEKHRPEVILHAAARIPQSANEDIYTFFDDNVTATINLYHSALATGVRRVVLSSSMSVYGRPQFLPVSEEHPAVPDFPYALSKIQAELTARHFAESGLETTVLRYSGIFGEGQRSGAVPAFIGRCLDNSPLTLNAKGRPSSDFVWVNDAVQANLLAAVYLQPRAYEVMNIGSGVELTVLQLAEKIRDLCGSHSTIEPVNGPSPRDFRFSYNIERARTILGFNPTPMDSALEKCIRQKREHRA